MNLAVEKAEFFLQDYAKQFSWYVDEAGDNIARRFQVSLDQTLNRLARKPDLGRVRHFRNPRLRDLRSIPIERPCNKLLIFYRVSSDVLHAVRLMHGARDLPQRLLERPAFDGG